MRYVLLLLLLGSIAGCGAAATSAQAPQSSVTTVDAEHIAATATWAPGQLAAHFGKHGAGFPNPAAYDAVARETIRHGTPFTYHDRESNLRRLGFYERAGNRFTAVTIDGRRITTHFQPDESERYVRGLAESTYR